MEKILENIAKGYDVMRGQTVIKHFNTKEGAEKFINGRHGYYVRYWILSDKEEQTARRLFFLYKSQALLTVPPGRSGRRSQNSQKNFLKKLSKKY